MKFFKGQLKMPFVIAGYNLQTPNYLRYGTMPRPMGNFHSDIEAMLLL